MLSQGSISILHSSIWLSKVALPSQCGPGWLRLPSVVHHLREEGKDDEGGRDGGKAEVERKPGVETRPETKHPKSGYFFKVSFSVVFPFLSPFSPPSPPAPPLPFPSLTLFPFHSTHSDPTINLFHFLSHRRFSLLHHTS